MRIVTVDASQPVHTPGGDLVANMCYGTFLESVLKPGEYKGNPNKGNMHVLHIKLSMDDLHAFLQIVKEHFGLYFKMEVEQFTSNVLKNLATANIAVE